jgi:hypothetical protein
MDSGSKSERNIISCKLQQDDDDENSELRTCGQQWWLWSNLIWWCYHQQNPPSRMSKPLCCSTAPHPICILCSSNRSEPCIPLHLLPHFELGPWHLGTDLHHYLHYLMPARPCINPYPTIPMDPSMTNWHHESSSECSHKWIAAASLGSVDFLLEIRIIQQNLGWVQWSENWPKNQGVLGISPFVADLVQIRMANATKQDLDLHIFRTSCPRAHIIPPAKLSWCELRFSSKSLESPGSHGDQSIQWSQNKETTAQFPCTWIQSGFQSTCKDVLYVCIHCFLLYVVFMYRKKKGKNTTILRKISCRTLMDFSQTWRSATV